MVRKTLSPVSLKSSPSVTCTSQKLLFYIASSYPPHLNIYLNNVARSLYPSHVTSSTILCSRLQSFRMMFLCPTIFNPIPLCIYPSLTSDQPSSILLKAPSANLANFLAFLIRVSLLNRGPENFIYSLSLPV